MGTQPGVVLDVVDLYAFGGIDLEHFGDQVLGAGAQFLGHGVNSLLR